MPDPTDIVYAAHTASCTFLLDREGICRRILMTSGSKRRESSRTASRCVGTQYVASLDTGAAGGLVEMPRVGAALLFARVDERGRVSLVRTGPLVRFETMRAEDPFAESGGVHTSASKLPPRHPDPDYFDASERTQPALRPRDLVALAFDGSEPITAELPAAAPYADGQSISIVGEESPFLLTRHAAAPTSKPRRRG